MDADYRSPDRRFDREKRISEKRSQHTRIFEALVDYEKDLPHGQSGEYNRFVANNHWLINTRYINNLFLYDTGLTRHKIPGLYRTNIYGLLKNYLTKKKTLVSLVSAADAIQIKEDGSRLRAFYLRGWPRRHTVKIVAEGSAYFQRARREIATRRRLAELKAIDFPRIEGVHEGKGFLFLAEELVLGRRFNGRRDRKLFLHSVLPQLAEMYRKHGVRYQPIDRYLPSDILTRMDNSLANDTAAAQLRRAMKGIIESHKEAAVSLCHGDLLPSNLAVAGRRVSFLDWEMAQEDVIAFDLLRMALKYPRLDYLGAAIRDTMVGHFTDEGCGFEDLLAAYVTRRAVQDPLRAGEYLTYLRRHAPGFG